MTLGIIPGAAGTQTLPRAIGLRRAKEVVLTGRPFSAEDALAWGVVKRVCADGRLLDLKNGYDFEIEAYNRTVGTEDRIEGIRAFNEKRKPVYKGR